VSDTLQFKAQSGKQLAFLSSPVDFAVYGGSRGAGKSFALLLEALRNTSNKDFSAVIFRRTYKQIEQEGGLWETSNKIYPYCGATGSFGNLTWKFPIRDKDGKILSPTGGAKVRFSHMEDENNRFDWLGSSVPLICFDELVTFTEEQVVFMFGSNRSTCGVRPYMRATTNPDSKSWVAKLISWWINPETGYPIEERSGKVRWFIRVKDSWVWGDSKEELNEKYPEIPPKSFTFIPAKVYDNRILLEKDPSYISSLYALGQVDRERYLHGNWKISDVSGKIFKREWFQIIPERPAGLSVFVRYWDVASTEPNKKNKDPDWTCGVLISLKDGIWYILDVQRFRGTPAVVEKRVKQTAAIDPFGTRIRMEEEPGSSGITATDHYARFVLVGFDFKGIKSLKNKQLRAAPVSSAAEVGNVKLIRGNWNMDYLDELENFKGLDEKNDQVDATSGGFNELKGAGGDMKFAIATATTKYDACVPASVGSYDKIGLL